MDENLDLNTILDSLSSDEKVRASINLEFIIEELSKHLTRRQTIILRLLLLENISQVEISKMLGFSASTICLELKKIRRISKKILGKK